MLERLAFYIKHSFNDLRVNGQRTFFALLCIGAGVAAIVSLQTLATMIESTLTGNLQEQNLGDISMEYQGFMFNTPTFGEDFDEEFGDNMPRPSDFDERVREDREAGYFGTADQGFGGFSVTEERINEAGLQAIIDALDERFPGQVDVTFKMALANFGQVFIGNGPGVNVVTTATDVFESNFSPIVIDPAKYPFYNDAVLEDGRSLAQAFSGYNGDNPGIVFSRDGANALGEDGVPLAIGDRVLLDGSDATFEVIGIVPTDTEIRNIQSGFQYGLYGYYYYIDAVALNTFGDVPLLVENIYVQIADASRLMEVSAFLWQTFPYLNQTTTEDLRELNSEIASSLDTLVTIMGLLGVLLGSIGIINTMQVVVRRRTVEIAVLKTLGLQGNQVTLLFLTQAFIMGVLGSILGVALGWLMVFVLRNSAEGVLRQGLGFVISPNAVFNGLVVGTLVTTVFGFLPTLSAGQVRPGIVLRPDDIVVPRAGIIASLFTLVGMIIVLAFIAQAILGTSFLIAFLVVAGAFGAAGVIFVLLWLLIWIVGRFTPSFGFVDMKLSKRQLLASKRRGAVTLLALVIAVFSLSTITLFADSFTNFLNSIINSENAQPVIIQSLTPQSNAGVERILTQNADVTSYRVNRTFNDVQFVGIDRANGDSYTLTQLNDLRPIIPFGTTSPDFAFGYIGAYTAEQVPPVDLIAGVTLDQAPETDALPILIPQTWYTAEDYLAVGDDITLRVNGRELRFTVVGVHLVDETAISLNTSVAQVYALWPDLQEAGLQPQDINFSAALPAENVSNLRREMSAIPGVFVFDTRNIERLVNVLLDQFRAFPTLVALLGLVVGGVVIANSVALATMERRKEIAVMKSVGLQRERVLFMLLLENGLLGLVGGLLGVGTGLLTLVLLSSSINLPLDVIPFGAAFLLMSLCVLVAVIAAMTTAWGASGEKPLNVLRYE